MSVDQNALNTVLYALSTISQTCAALAALVGALALYRLQAMREAHSSTYAALKAIAMPQMGRGDATVAEVLRFGRANLNAEHSSLSPSVIEILRGEMAEWDRFDSRYANAVRILIQFEAWNLLAILAALLGFASASWLASHWLVFVIALVALSVGTVGVTGGALYSIARREGGAATIGQQVS